VGEDVEFVLDYNTFYQYLEEDTAEYLEKYPYYRARVEELLAKIRERFNIQSVD